MPDSEMEKIVQNNSRQVTAQVRLRYLENKKSMEESDAAKEALDYANRNICGDIAYMVLLARLSLRELFEEDPAMLTKDDHDMMRDVEDLAVYVKILGF